MLKNYFLTFFLILLAGCANPGTAFLGPIFTGAKTGSAYQASVSFGTNQIVKKIKDDSKKHKSKKISEKSFNHSPN